MENPYYEIIMLIKSLTAQRADSAFTAEIGLDDEQKPIVTLNGQPVDEPFWVPDGLEITEEDDGCAVLCAQIDRGYMILAKLWKL